jgi:hypothetical protein
MQINCASFLAIVIGFTLLVQDAMAGLRGGRALTTTAPFIGDITDLGNNVYQNPCFHSEGETEVPVESVYFEAPSQLGTDPWGLASGYDAAKFMKVGLSPNPDDWAPTYYFTVTIYEGGKLRSGGRAGGCPDTKWAAGDNFELKREGNFVNFYQNDVLQCSNDHTGVDEDLFGFINFWDSGCLKEDRSDGCWSTDNLLYMESRIVATAAATAPSDNDYAVIFTGHDQLLSVNAGNLDLQWSPAFVYEITDDEALDRFVDKGSYTYTVVVAPENEVTFDTELSNSEIIAQANANSAMKVVETQERSASVNGLVANQRYSVLVIARAAGGYESSNRVPGTVAISEFDPIPAISNLLVMPEPDVAFTIEFLNELAIQDEISIDVEVTGNYPAEFAAVVSGDWAYVFGNDGQSESNMKIVEVESVVIQGSALVWNCKVRQMKDVFIDLDLNVELKQSVEDLETTEELSDEDDLLTDQIVDGMLENLPEKVKIDFCLMLYNIDDSTCFDDSTTRMLNTQDGRQLFWSKKSRRTLRRAFRKATKVAKKVVNIVKKTAAKVAKAIAQLSATLDTSISFLDIDKTAKMSCETDNKLKEITYDASFEAGVGFDLSAKASFKIKVSVSRGLDEAEFSLVGGFGASAYVLLGATAQSQFAPDPITLFKLSRTNTFVIGVIPIVITNRPRLDSYIEVNAIVEAEALVSTQVGWDYEFTFLYNGKASDDKRFEKIKQFVKRPMFEEEPDFSLRVAANMELGLQFSWDILLYGTLQTTLAADVGLIGDLEVGTSLEAMVVSSPYFYTLDMFDVEAFLVIRAELGLNNAIKKVVKEFTGVQKQATSAMCTFSITGNGLMKPSLVSDGLINDMPASLQSIYNVAMSEDRYAAAKDLTIDTIMDEMNLDDAFLKGATELYDLVGEFLDGTAVSFELYSTTFPIFSLPEVEIEEPNVETCQGDSAIVLTFTSDIDGDIAGGQWFGNFDGSIVSEDSDWEMISDPWNPSMVTIRLPRSTPGTYEVPEGMSVLLRSTPSIFPIENALFSKHIIDDVIRSSVAPFECCDDSDCGNGEPCNSGQCNSIYPFPACEDLNPTNESLEAHFSVYSHAVDYCENECAPFNTNCDVWTGNYPH